MRGYTSDMRTAPLMTVVSASGGAGKSTIALLCACLAARAGVKTTLLEGDLQFGDYGVWLGLDEELPDLSLGAECPPLALADCLELAEVMREIQVTRDKVEEIDDVLAQMDEDDARILRLWYIERKSKDEITEAVCYSSTSSLYDIRNKALVRFALLYFGAGAMPSM